MLNPSNIIRSRRKTLSMFVNQNGELIVKAPLHLADRKIYEFVKTKERWIEAQKKRVLQIQFLNKSVLTYHSFLYLGEELLPLICNKAKRVERSSSYLLVPAKLAGQGEEKVLKKIEKWLRDEAKFVINERVMYFRAKLNLEYASFITNNNKTRWGSCSRSGALTLNWRAVMLPPSLLDYIVVHEFCHLLEFNHSKAFWKLVDQVLPNWKDLRLRLKNLNWLLNLFR
ncbi:MAG: M48 family metallopeptidase [Firmicutes bacterium]|nr:M48 family metallopeptidase [Bacillota bacterium]